MCSKRLATGKIDVIDVIYFRQNKRKYLLFNFKSIDVHSIAYMLFEKYDLMMSENVTHPQFKNIRKLKWSIILS